MQYIDGCSLAQVLRDLRPEVPAVPTADPAGSSGATAARRSRRDCRSAARLGVQAAEALEHAHAIGVVHRDIKPFPRSAWERGARAPQPTD